MIRRYLRRAWIWILASTFLVGCPGSFRPGTARVDQMEDRSLAQLHIDWIDAGLPQLSDDCSFLRFRKYLVDDEELANMCWNMCPPGNCPDEVNPKCPRGCAAGCYFEDSDGDDIHPTAVVHQSQDPLALVRHEALHYMSFCAGMGWDRLHKKSEVWRLE